MRTGLPRRVVQLYLGLVLYGLSMALMVRARLGLDPWDVFHQGLSERTGLSFGTCTIVAGVVVMLLWIPLRQRPGLGTISNVIVIGVAVDWFLRAIPVVDSFLLRVPMLLGGVALCALGGGMYIGARFGPGPRDGLMTGWSARWGKSIRLVRTLLELSVLVVGFCLGGSPGAGTVVFAVAIGPLTQLFLRVFTVPPRAVDGPEDSVRRPLRDAHPRRSPRPSSGAPEPDPAAADAPSPR